MRVLVCGSRDWGVCPRVAQRMECPECGYPSSGAVWVLDGSVPHNDAAGEKKLMYDALMKAVGIGGLGDTDVIIDLVPLELIHGCAPGADTLSEEVAKEIYKECGGPNKITRFPADWKKYGRGAGPVRNQEMLTYLLEAAYRLLPGEDIFHDDKFVLAFWKNKSRGTADMIRRARKAGVEVRVIEGWLF